MTFEKNVFTSMTFLNNFRTNFMHTFPGNFFLRIHPTHETRAIDFMISPHQHDNISKLLKMNTVESKSDYIYHEQSLNSG